MSDTVIRVENLSKKYIIRHQQAQQYTALRDVIADEINLSIVGLQVERKTHH